VQSSENRRFVRHPSDIPLSYDLEKVVVDRKEYLNNISHGGLSFRSAQPIAAGTAIHIRIPLVQPKMDVHGVVAWCKSRRSWYDIGVEFDQTDDAFRMRMVEQICHIEHYKREILRREGRSLSGEQAAVEWIERFAGDFPRFSD
jgi:hypothetical protein